MQGSSTVLGGPKRWDCYPTQGKANQWLTLSMSYNISLGCYIAKMFERLTCTNFCRTNNCFTKLVATYDSRQLATTFKRQLHKETIQLRYNYTLGEPMGGLFETGFGEKQLVA